MVGALVSCPVLRRAHLLGQEEMSWPVVSNKACVGGSGERCTLAPPPFAGCCALVCRTSLHMSTNRLPCPFDTPKQTARSLAGSRAESAQPFPRPALSRLRLFRVLYHIVAILTAGAVMHRLASVCAPIEAASRNWNCNHIRSSRFSAPSCPRRSATRRRPEVKVTVTVTVKVMVRGARQGPGMLPLQFGGRCTCI
jgi:hypothetical protein